MESQSPSFDTFEDFLAALDVDQGISDRLARSPQLGEQIRAAMRKLYERAQADSDFRQLLSASPEETTLKFVEAELADMELSESELGTVAGGEITVESSLGYDVGYAIGTVAEWIADCFK